MKMSYKLFVPVLLLLPTWIIGTAMNHGIHHELTSVTAEPTADTSWTKQKASAWFNAKKWMNGMTFKPHSSIDQLEFARQYNSNKARWDKGFAYLKSTDLKNIKAGHYQIDGEDVYANVTEAPSKEFDQTQYEVHQDYSDIHMLISGKEKISVTTFAGATVKTPYDATKDIGFWNKEGGKIYTMEPGTFYIFCPGTPHRPTIKVEGQNIVKKIVVKVKSAGK